MKILNSTPDIRTRWFHFACAGICTCLFSAAVTAETGDASVSQDKSDGPIETEAAAAPVTPPAEKEAPAEPLDEEMIDGLEVPVIPDASTTEGSVLPGAGGSDGIEGGDLPGLGPMPTVASGTGKKDQIITLSETFQPVPLSGITLIPDQRKKIGDVFVPSVQPTAGFSAIAGLSDPPDREGLESKLRSKFLGKPLTFGGLEELVQTIQAHYIDQGRMLTHVFVPNQLMTDKVLIAVLEGKVTSIAAETLVPEDRNWWDSWYAEPYRLDDLTADLQQDIGGLSSMEPKVLDDELVGLNTSPWARLKRPVQHPFRNVSARYGPVDDRLGESEVTLLVEQSRPLKFFLGYDDALTEVLGEDRIFAGAVWYDAFALNLDHQLAFQVFTGLDSNSISGIAGSYIIPWEKWKMTTELFGAYSTSEAAATVGGLPSTVTGDNVVLGIRHYYELPPIVDGGEVIRGDRMQREVDGTMPWYWAGKLDRQSFGIFHEVGIGFDLKMIESGLEFFNQAVAPSDADLLQAILAYNVRQTDGGGETNLAWTNVFGIGGSSDAELQLQRQGAEADYFYTRVDLRREQDIPFGMLLTGRLSAQYASANLLQSEQLGIGGYNSVRGYSERAFRGDSGWLASLELYSPPMYPLGSFFPGLNWQDELRFLIFTDWGSASAEQEFIGDPFDDEQTLGSFGIGLRYDVNDVFRLRLDYGFQLETLPTPPYSTESGDSRIHIGAVFTF